MARVVYFAFHYQKDIWRVNQVRNSDITKKDRDEAGFYDGSLWEEAQKKGNLKAFLNKGISGSTVTVVLIGNKTHERPWVRYEIIKSFDRGNGQLGIYIHQLENQKKEISIKGINPFEDLMLSIDTNGVSKYYEWNGAKWILFSELPNCSLVYDKKYWGKNYRLDKIYNTYDWVNNNGYKNFGDWVEVAAKEVGK